MSEKNFICKKLGKEDIMASAKVVFEAFNAYSAEKNEPMIPDPSIVSDRIAEYEADTGIQGFLYGGFLDEEQIAFLLVRKLGIDDEAWEISMLAVVPEQQDKGYGRKMVEFALREIMELKGVLAVCAVTDGNDKALKLFADQGFESEASGIPVSETMSIWMLRKDMKNAMAAAAVEEERRREKAEMDDLKEIKIEM